MLKRVAAAAAAAALVLAASAPAGAEAQKASRPDAQAIEAIYGCLVPGLPQGWKRAWISVKVLAVTNKARRFEAELLYSESAGGDKGITIPKLACEPKEVAERVQALNLYLAPEQRNWRLAKLEFAREGENISYKLTYKYPPGDRAKRKAPAAQIK